MQPAVPVSDLLLHAEGSRGLIAGLGEALAALGAEPAELWLADVQARVLYQGAVFGGAAGAADAPLPGSGAPLPPGDLALRRNGELVGVLRVPVARQSPAVEQLAALLGPLLVLTHRLEIAQNGLAQAQDLNLHLVAAGDLLRHLNLEVLLVKVLETVLGALHAQVAAVVTPDAQGKPVARVTWGLREDHLALLRLADGREVAAAVLADRQILNLSAEQIAQGALQPVPGVTLHGLLALPLVSRDQAQGVVVLANPEGVFAAGEQRLAETLCAMAAIALDNALLVKATVEGERIRQEMDLARGVQAGMFPGSALTVGELVLAGGSRPCSETGGDYYTWLERDNRVVAMIADVSGHGLGAALYTTMAHALAQQQLRSGASLEAAFKVINEGLCHTHSGRFMTAAIVDVDPADGTLRYTSAGHNPLLWIHHGEIRWLDSLGMPLGVMDDGTFPEGEEPLRMASGDVLVLYTDGFVEAVNSVGSAFGDEPFAAMIKDAWTAGATGAEIAALAHATVDRWTEGRPHDDDLTMIVIRYR
jgi:serine phosphatase RsbU (regulator of sigma subunit)